jgi:chloramphenicol 3-O phosphotransferase
VATSSNGAAAWPIMRTCVVTTDLTVRPPGHVIVLNGASSSGKSTLARRLQDTLSVPFLLLSGDQLVEACVLPARRDTAGPFAWVQEMRPRFFDGFHRCIPAMAAAGNNVIVEHVVEFAEWRTQLDHLLHGYDVFWVAVHCDLAEIDRREAARGNRTPGEGRAHIEQNRIHDHGAYTLPIDTTHGVTDDLVQTVIDEWSGTRRSRG